MQMLGLDPSSIQNDQKKSFRVGDTVTISCYQNYSNLAYMFWYWQPPRNGLKLMQTVEIHPGACSFKPYHFKELSVWQEEHNSTAGYSLIVCSRITGQLTFGAGTVLRVIEKNREVIPPAVAIFSPSKQEIQQKNKATLVCLASGFYPDHLTLVWMVNDVKRTAGVGTDEFSTQNGSTYSLTSRLRIPAWEWFNPLNRFECVAKFFQKEKEESIHKFIYGDAESYLRYGNSAKLTYLILCGKALIYAVLVSSLVWTAKALLFSYTDVGIMQAKAEECLESFGSRESENAIERQKE
ncbi:hypothetical protein WISP_38300 [Willisornis vidua]|uniref:Ig-like domain-containing protein n=1 Tax=Willisornis vidua TaxID=1566151 RepID=A0ABQ9DMX9_9PASS|nr:hypothetical protein WISP_38300 [Willisornis vidua]